MQTLYILLPVLFFLLLLLLAPIRFSIGYHQGLRLTVHYLFFSFLLHPRKRPKKEKKRKKRAPKKTAAPQRRISKHPKKKAPLRFGDIRFLLRILGETTGAILEKFSHHVRIKIHFLRITIGGERDAARAAIEYGLLSQGVSYLIACLYETRFLKPPRHDAVDLRVDFTKPGHALSARISVSCPILFLIPLALSAITKLLTAKGRWTRYRAKQKHNFPDSKKGE